MKEKCLKQSLVFRYVCFGEKTALIRALLVSVHLSSPQMSQTVHYIRFVRAACSSLTIAALTGNALRSNVSSLITLDFSTYLTIVGPTPARKARHPPC